MKKKNILLSLTLGSAALFTLASCNGDKKEDESSSVASSIVATSKVEASSTIESGKTGMATSTSEATSEATSEILSSSDETTSKAVEDLGSYTVNVYDIDGEKLSTYEIDIEKDKSFVEQLKSNANVKYTDESWGTYITSIDNSVVDSNYFLALYENNVASMVGVDLIELNDGDVIDFKTECFASYDETDKLVDKAIYQYIKKYLKNDFIKDETFSNYWSYICYDLMEDTAKNYVTLNTEMSSYLDTFDVTTLTGTNYGKYYYTARAYDKNLDSYKTQYKTFLDTLNSVGSFAEYSLPFEVSPAVKLEISSNILDVVKNSDYKPGTDDGYDGANWFYATQQLLGKTKDDEFLGEISKASYNNPTSLALSIGSFAASNVNPRQATYEVDGEDLIEKLLKNYDSELGLIKYASTDTGTVYSTNQIYTALISYKLFRDNGKAINYFA